MLFIFIFVLNVLVFQRTQCPILIHAAKLLLFLHMSVQILEKNV